MDQMDRHQEAMELRQRALKRFGGRAEAVFSRYPKITEDECRWYASLPEPLAGRIRDFIPQSRPGPKEMESPSHPSAHQSCDAHPTVDSDVEVQT